MKFNPQYCCGHVLTLCAALLVGCSGATNPSFPTDLDMARKDLKRMESARRPLDRPLVIVGGVMDPGIAPSWLKTEFSSVISDDRIIWIQIGDCMSLDACREKIVTSVDKAFPTDSKTGTRAVDVVGYSLGGLAARYAAGPSGPGKRLTIARLFTISSPLRGAKLAEDLPVVLHPIQPAVKPGSSEMVSLNAKAPDYPIYPYVCLGDDVIGESNAAPPGHTPWWVAPAPLVAPHNGAYYDARFLADIARRLRNEPALSSEPPAMLP